MEKRTIKIVASIAIGVIACVALIFATFSINKKTTERKNKDTTSSSASSSETIKADETDKKDEINTNYKQIVTDEGVFSPAYPIDDVYTGEESNKGRNEYFLSVEETDEIKSLRNENEPIVSYKDAILPTGHKIYTSTNPESYYYNKKIAISGEKIIELSEDEIFFNTGSLENLLPEGGTQKIKFYKTEEDVIDAKKRFDKGQEILKSDKCPKTPTIIMDGQLIENTTFEKTKDKTLVKLTDILENYTRFGVTGNNLGCTLTTTFGDVLFINSLSVTEKVKASFNEIHFEDNGYLSTLYCSPFTWKEPIKYIDINGCLDIVSLARLTGWKIQEGENLINIVTHPCNLNTDYRVLIYPDVEKYNQYIDKNGKTFWKKLKRDADGVWYVPEDAPMLDKLPT